jgi:hypothetical protein
LLWLGLARGRRRLGRWLRLLDHLRLRLGGFRLRGLCVGGALLALLGVEREKGLGELGGRPQRRLLQQRGIRLGQFRLHETTRIGRSTGEITRGSAARSETKAVQRHQSTLRIARQLRFLFRGFDRYKDEIST